MIQRTVDRNCHDLGQEEVIGTNKRRNASKRIELEILDVCDGSKGLHEFDIEIIGFSNRQEDCGTGISLHDPVSDLNVYTVASFAIMALRGVDIVCSIALFLGG